MGLLWNSTFQCGETDYGQRILDFYTWGKVAGVVGRQWDYVSASAALSWWKICAKAGSQKYPDEKSSEAEDGEREIDCRSKC